MRNTFDFVLSKVETEMDQSGPMPTLLRYTYTPNQTIKNI